VITLFEEDRIVCNFMNMDDAFLNVPVPRGDGPVSPLARGEAMQLPEGIDAWIEDRALTSLLVLKDGEIRYEEYFKGTGPDDLRISWSLAKSYLSALVGILVDEGAIASLDAPVTDFAPGLIGSGYDGATIRNVLRMSSGVIFDEDYLDFHSDIQRMGRIVALGGKLDDFSASFPERFAEPGEEWQYVSIDTHVIGMVIRGATGRTVTELMAEKIIAPLGLERDGFYITDGAGTAFVLGGLNFTTRDYARFGVMMQQDGLYGGRQVVPAEWVAESTAASARTQPGKYGYGYQWWIPVGAEPGEFLGRGIYGQYLYIDRHRGVVIVVTSADRRFREPGRDAANIEKLREIARSL
jgi:CubicO group peptidase (beta-lactamase class C family)